MSSKLFNDTMQGLIEAVFIESKRKKLICEDDNFKIPDKYKNMSIEELKLAKEKLYRQIKNNIHTPKEP